MSYSVRNLKVASWKESVAIPGVNFLPTPGCVRFLAVGTHSVESGCWNHTGVESEGGGQKQTEI